MTPGVFITIEGIEGVGKSTNLAHIESVLKAHQIDYVVTREPGGTPLAEQLRTILLDKTRVIDSRAELLMMFAARAQHVEELIKPALAEGKWIICDRFTDSTYAYQGGGRGLDQEVIQQLETVALGNFRPDHTLLLDVAVTVGLSRAAATGEKDRFEVESNEFFSRVRQVFLDRAADEPDRFHCVDAGLSLDQVQATISQWLEGIISEHA